MLDLEDFQFEILPSEDASEGVGFGLNLDISVEEEGFQPGGNEWTTQDGESSYDGTTVFGRDVLLGPTWGWDLFTNRGDVAGAVESVSKIAKAWRASEIRRTANAVLPLRYGLDGRVRRIYGRPRGFEAPPSNRILSGMVPITCDFKCVDSYTYDDIPTAAAVGASALSDGGLTFPLTLPQNTLPPSESPDAAVIVGGDAETYPYIYFEGPGTFPELTVTSSRGTWVLSVDVSLGPLEYIEVDLRPWKRTVLKNGTQNIAGRIGRQQWMADMVLEPGEYNFSLKATTGTPTCAVSWRNAWNSI